MPMLTIPIRARFIFFGVCGSGRYRLADLVSNETGVGLSGQSFPGRRELRC
jgi:hypothetical protein